MELIIMTFEKSWDKIRTDVTDVATMKNEHGIVKENEFK